MLRKSEGPRPRFREANRKGHAFVALRQLMSCGSVQQKQAHECAGGARTPRESVGARVRGTAWRAMEGSALRSEVRLRRDDAAEGNASGLQGRPCMDGKRGCPVDMAFSRLHVGHQGSHAVQLSFLLCVPSSVAAGAPQSPCIRALLNAVFDDGRLLNSYASLLVTPALKDNRQSALVTC